MKIGTLVPHRGTKRMGIRFSLTSYYGVLHRGDIFDIKVNGKWVPTRIKRGQDWILVRVKTNNLVVLIVRI